MRVLRHAAIAGSALVCVAAVADRVWDHWAGHGINLLTERPTGTRHAYGSLFVRTSQGVVIVGVERTELPGLLHMHKAIGAGYSTSPSSDHSWRTGNSLANQLGYCIQTDEFDIRDLGVRTNSSYVEVPHWFIATLAAIAPAVWLTGRLRRRRDRDADRCRRCGYDLRATPDRCPECGESRAIA